MDIRQSKEYTRALSRMGWKVRECGMQNGKKMRVLIRRIPLVGLSVAKAQRFDSLPAWEEWKKILKEERVIYSALEPNVGYHLGGVRLKRPPSQEITLPSQEKHAEENLKKNRYFVDKNVFIPSRTRIIDLTKGEAELIKEMDQGTRRWLRKKTKVEVVEVKLIELESWWKEWKLWKKGYFPGIDELKIYGEEFGRKKVWMGAKMRVGMQIPGQARNDEWRWVGGIVMYMTEDTATYYLAWSSREGKDNGAQYKLTWECMKRAKKMGVKRWDFEGINDPRWPRKSWQGFSEFKRRWGGEEVEMPGCWSRWF